MTFSFLAWFVTVSNTPPHALFPCHGSLLLYLPQGGVSTRPGSEKQEPFQNTARPPAGYTQLLSPTAGLALAWCHSLGCVMEPVRLAHYGPLCPYRPEPHRPGRMCTKPMVNGARGYGSGGRDICQLP